MSLFNSTEFNHERERLSVFLGDNGLHHSWWCMEIPRTFEEILNESSVNLVALPNGGIKVVAEDAVDIPLVVFLPHEQKEGIAVLANGGAEIHKFLVHVLVAGLLLGDLDRFTADFWDDTVLLYILLVRQM